MEDGQGGARVWNYALLLGDLSASGAIYYLSRLTSIIQFSPRNGGTWFHLSSMMDQQAQENSTLNGNQ